MNCEYQEPDFLDSFGYDDEDDPRGLGRHSALDIRHSQDQAVDYDDTIKSAIDNTDTDELASQEKNDEAMDNQIEGYMDRTGCSYYLACRHFGLTIEEPQIIGPCVSLAARALYLSSALDSYLKYSRSVGHEYAYEHGQHTIEDVQKTKKSEKYHKQKGKTMFYKAFGANALVNAGFKDEVVVGHADADIKDFMDTYIGSDKEKSKARTKYRKVLHNYIK